MASRPGTSRQARNVPVSPRTAHDTAASPVSPQQNGRDRPLPPLPPSSSLPSSYDIPTLRQRTEPGKSNRNSTHNRSASQPFPSFFGSRKSEKKQVGRRSGDSDTSDDATETKQSSRKGSVAPVEGTASTPRPSGEPVTGTCMTCNSTVRWPQDIKTFRCTTCQTVNDLEPIDSQQDHAARSAGRYPAARKALPISLESTRKLRDYCLDTYLHQQVELFQKNGVTRVEDVELPFSDDENDTSISSERKTAITRLAPPPTNFKLRSSPNAKLPSPLLSPSPTTIPGGQSTLAGPRTTPSPNPSDRSRQSQKYEEDYPKRPTRRENLFDPLERYISSCCRGCTPFNMSFFSVKPAVETSTQHNPQQGRKMSSTTTTPQFEPDAFISEIDAKTLLLGDVAENGLWWTGERSAQQNRTYTDGRQRSPERWKGIVSAKTPRIHWNELAEWYHIIIHAGEDWQRRWNVLKPDARDSEQYNRWASVSVQRMQVEIGESQARLQRTLLKCTENLLKRPRRPLKNPEDCRFLLMLLTNPLLALSSPLPTSDLPISADNAAVENMTNLRGNQQQKPPTKVARDTAGRRGDGLGHHSGIIKRILGLLSNLPNEIHQFLVSWMARFSDSHFQRLVEMVGKFVTYRLSRPKEQPVKESINPTYGLVPSFSDDGISSASQLHAALDVRSSGTERKKKDGKPKLDVYSDDWQVRAAARFMALLFQANVGHSARKRDNTITPEQRLQSAGLNARYQANSHGQIVPISNFYNTMLDHADLTGDFEAWESAAKTRFTFCQYPFFLSIWAKIHIMEFDARRQMEVRAREAFFDSILRRKAVSQFLVLKVRRECLVEDSLKAVSEVVGSGSDDIKKGLRIDFVGEEGIDAGGLRKEWFLSLVREIFDPLHGLFIYDEDSRYCYFNPCCFESSEQFFLVGVLVGLAIYNSTILDVAFPPFVFKKMLASAPTAHDKLTSMPRIVPSYTLEDLAEYRPSLAKGLRQLLDFEGDVKDTFCRNFVIETERYGQMVEVPLCAGGENRAVTQSNRREFVDLYVRYLLDTAVARQYEPFKRGFFTVCGGNALSLFRPEEIELLVRGSDEPLDVDSLRAVATYDNWPTRAGPPDQQPQVLWFWETFTHATPSEQRKLLGFITGSDRIPAMGATNLIVRVQLIRDKEIEEKGRETQRFPIARTCFNTISLHPYRRRETLEAKLWTAVRESEGFGLK